MNGVGAVTINRKTDGGRYEDVLDVASELSGRHGSATNAIAEMVRESPSYKQVIARRNKSKKVSRETGVEQPDEIASAE